jgi:hypothetical protein
MSKKVYIRTFSWPMMAAFTLSGFLSEAKDEIEGL